MKLLRWLDNRLEETIMILAAIVIGIIILLQVIMRYFFKNALPWPEELCRFSYIYFVFMSIGYSIRNHSMLNVTMIQDMLPKGIRMLVDVVIQIAMVIVFALFAYYSLDILKATVVSGQKSTALQISMAIPYLATTIGFVLATIRSVQSTILSIGKMKAGEDIKVSALEAIEDELSDEVKTQMKLKD